MDPWEIVESNHDVSIEFYGVGISRKFGQLRFGDHPLWFGFLGTALLIMIAIEIGFRVGTAARNRSDGVKEAPVGAITGSILALLAFMLAFTFGIVSNRYDARKALVREQAITISTSYARTDFLPEPERAEAKAIFASYIDLVLQAAEPKSYHDHDDLIAQMNAYIDQLWAMAVAQSEINPDSDVMALYLDSLNSVGDVQAIRLTVAVHSKIPIGIWIALLMLVCFATSAVGYQTALSGSKRTWLLLVMAFSFATIVSLITMLDNPDTGFIPVSQRPIIDVQTAIEASQAP